MRPIAVIRFQTSAPLGIAADALDDTGAPWFYLDAWKATRWPSPSEIGGVIVLGGEMNVDATDAYPFLLPARELLISAVEQEVPVFGICLGCQMLARALGASVRPAPVREIGFVEVRATASGTRDPVLSPFSPALEVFQFHEDAFELPIGAELLFEGSAISRQAFRFGESAYGVQFHFEVDERIIDEWCDETPDLEKSWNVTKDQLLIEARTHLPAQQAAGSKAVRAWVDLTTR